MAMNDDFDFGFTTHTEEEYQSQIEQAKTDGTLEAQSETQTKMQQVEQLILPLLNNLLETADKPWIHWPNRGPMIEEQIKKITAITRST